MKTHKNTGIKAPLDVLAFLKKQCFPLFYSAVTHVKG